jgi:hypothetical protein
MLFNIEADHGGVVSGYVVPDGFVESPNIVVRHEGRDILARPADEVRAALVVAGRHETGACGFTIDEQAVPGLGAMEDLEIYEVETQTLLYRRRRAHHVSKKILRLETHLFPLWRLDSALNSLFQHSVNQIENMGRETSTQVFVLNHVNSAYISGRILYKNYSYYAESKFEVIFLMHHPLEEFAERLIILAQIKKTGSGILGTRDNLSLRTAMDFAQSLSFHDDKALRRELRNIPTGVAQILANPITRQLTTSTPDEMPSNRGVSLALDTLSSFSVVGLRRAQGTFMQALAELVGVESAYLAGPTKLPGVAALAQMLKRTRAADELLEQDLEVYHHIANAYRKSAPPMGPAR